MEGWLLLVKVERGAWCPESTSSTSSATHWIIKGGLFHLFHVNDCLVYRKLILSCGANFGLTATGSRSNSVSLVRFFYFTTPFHPLLSFDQCFSGSRAIITRRDIRSTAEGSVPLVVAAGRRRMRIVAQCSSTEVAAFGSIFPNVTCKRTDSR